MTKGRNYFELGSQHPFWRDDLSLELDRGAQWSGRQMETDILCDWNSTCEGPEMGLSLACQDQEESQATARGSCSREPGRS